MVLKANCRWQNIQTTCRQVRCQCYHQKIATMMAPMQLGAGVRFGAEAAAHAARSFINNMLEDRVFLKIDFAHAYKTVRRDCVVDAFKLHAPDIYPFVKRSYEQSSFLCNNHYVILSSEGFQQIDPIASIGFCSFIHHPLTNFASKFKCGFLDDISAGDNWKIVLQDLKKLTDEARKLRLMIKPTKCELTVKGENTVSILEKFNAICTGIELISVEDVIFLDLALGEKSIDTILEKKNEEFKRFCTNIKDISKHQVFFLVKTAGLYQNFFHISYL